MSDKPGTAEGDPIDGRALEAARIIWDWLRAGEEETEVLEFCEVGVV